MPQKEWAKSERGRKSAREASKRYKVSALGQRRYLENLLKLYGLSIESFEKLKDFQNKRCAICYEEKKLCVDHDHNTGRVRGLLCRQCNLMLGAAKDKKRILFSAIDYLNKSKGDTGE